MRLVMTLLVRDEEDLLRANLEHHIQQGVDFFLITDNGSNDGTSALAADYEARGLAELILEPSDTYEQSAWVTRMARAAAERHGADWVIHSDADEFWIAREPGQTLRQAVEAIPEGCRRVFVPRWNAVVTRELEAASPAITPQDVGWFDSDPRNSLGDPLPPKVLHRADPQVLVAQGNHDATLHDPGVPDGPERLVILHFPYRGLSHYTHKIRLGGRAYLANPGPPSLGLTWRIDYRHYLAGRLPAICHWRLPDADAFAARLAEGRYRQAPNPLSPANAPPQPASPIHPQQPAADSVGIITLADDNYFCGTRLLTLSCAGRLPIIVYDLGLSEGARAWIDAQEGVSLRPIPDTPLIRAIRASPSSRSRPNAMREEWPLWICPSLIQDAPWQRVFWIDSDIVLLRDLEEMLSRLDNAPFIAEETLAPDATDNPEELYTWLPLGGPRDRRNRLRLNAGLSGWDRDRDAHLLDAYQFPIRLIFLAGVLPRDTLRWWDQGSLIWALQQAGYDDTLLQDRRWNLTVGHTALGGLRVAADADDQTLLAWIETIRQLEPEAAVVHWNGYNPVPWSA
jgi:hypothetical protein